MRGYCRLLVPERVAIPLGLYLRLSHLYGYLVSYDCFLVSHIVTYRNLQRGVLGKTKNPFPIFGLKRICVPELLAVRIYDGRSMEEKAHHKMAYNYSLPIWIRILSFLILNSSVRGFTHRLPFPFPQAIPLCFQSMHGQ